MTARDVVEKLGGRSLLPAYGHSSPETAYVALDYPYGFRERTRIRYWLEKDKKKGFRFVSQTENPKTKRWNAPKKSTYQLLAGAMYLDDKGHMTWSGLTEYSDAEQVLGFIKSFPEADLSALRPWSAAKVRMYEGLLSGKVFMTINDEKVPRSEADNERDRAELAGWQEVAREVGGKTA